MERQKERTGTNTLSRAALGLTLLASACTTSHAPTTPSLTPGLERTLSRPPGTIPLRIVGEVNKPAHGGYTTSRITLGNGSSFLTQAWHGLNLTTVKHGVDDAKEANAAIVADIPGIGSSTFSPRDLPCTPLAAGDDAACSATLTDPRLLAALSSLRAPQIYTRGTLTRQPKLGDQFFSPRNGKWQNYTFVKFLGGREGEEAYGPSTRMHQRYMILLTLDPRVLTCSGDSGTEVIGEDGTVVATTNAVAGFGKEKNVTIMRDHKGRECSEAFIARLF